MGTIAQKLNYSLEAKDLIKDGINYLGGNITDETTLKEYRDELDSVYAKLPKVTNSTASSSVTLNPTLKGRIDSTEYGQIGQYTTEGYNLLNINQLSQFSKIGANGQIIDTGIEVVTTINNDNAIVRYGFFDLLNYAGQQISVSSKIKSSANNKGMILLSQNNSNYSGTASNITYSDSQATTDGVYKVTMTVANEITNDNRYLFLTFYGRRGSTGASDTETVDYTNLMLYLGTDDKSYEPYTGRNIFTKSKL